MSIISHFLKRSTRDIDLASKIITYNELNGILSQRGFRLENPRGNRIDLIRFIAIDGETKLTSPKRIAHIGFHGWTKQASVKDINIVREATRLDAKHGYDSQSVFNGLDDPLTLIKKYKEPPRAIGFSVVDARHRDVSHVARGLSAVMFFAARRTRFDRVKHTLAQVQRTRFRHRSPSKNQIDAARLAHPKTRGNPPIQLSREML